MLKLKPESVDKGSTLDGYRLYGGENHRYAPSDGSDEIHHSSDLAHKITNKSHVMLSQYSSANYEIEENRPEEITTQGDSLSLPIADHGVGMREVIVGDGTDDPEMPYDLSRPVSEVDTEEHYTNPPSIATSTKSMDHLVLPEDSSDLFNHGPLNTSKENVVVERIEYEMPVIKREIIEPVIEPKSRPGSDYESDGISSLEAYRQFNVRTAAKNTSNKKSDPKPKKTGGKQARKRKSIPTDTSISIPVHGGILQGRDLLPLPPIQIPKIPSNFRPPIDIMPCVPTTIMKKHPTLSTILSFPPASMMPRQFLTNLTTSPSSRAPSPVKRVDSPSNNKTSTSRRKSKPKQRKIHIEQAPEKQAVAQRDMADESPTPKNPVDLKTDLKSAQSTDDTKAAHKEVKSLLAKKLRLSMESESAPPLVISESVPAKVKHSPAVRQSPLKRDFGSIRNLLNTAPLTDTVQLVTSETAVKQSMSPSSRRTLGQKLDDQTLADTYMKNWRQTGRFQCKFCPYSSVTKNYLFRHWLVNHNRECAYQCAYCDFCATYKDSITRHQSVNHAESEKHILVDAVLEGRIMSLFEMLFGLELGRSGVRRHLDSSKDDGFGFEGRTDSCEDEDEDEDMMVELSDAAAISKGSPIVTDKITRRGYYEDSPVLETISSRSSVIRSAAYERSESPARHEPPIAAHSRASFAKSTGAISSRESVKSMDNIQPTDLSMPRKSSPIQSEENNETINQERKTGSSILCW